MLGRTFALSLVVASCCACSNDGPGSSPGDTNPPALPVCGNGVPEEGENSGTCCLDAGCDWGVCDAVSNICVPPAALICPAPTGACADVKPYVCTSTPAPSYDCARCGCPELDVCYQAVCYLPETLNLERFAYDIPHDLPMDDYFAFTDWAATAEALTFDELVPEVDALLREDERRTALLMGESHGSADEQATALELMRGVVGNGWTVVEIGIEGGDSPLIDLTPVADLALPYAPITGDLTNGAYCNAAFAEASNILNGDGLYFQYTGSGHTSKEVCFLPEHYPICDLPHTAECLESVGRKAIVVIHFDPDVWLWSADRVLLWRTGDSYPDGPAVTAALEAAITGWQGHLAKHVQDPAFDRTVAGRAVNVRVVRGRYAEDLFIAFFPRPNRPAYLMQAFRALWSDPASQAFMLAHDIRPGNCSISWSLDPSVMSIGLYCDNVGYGVEAYVNANDFSLTSAVTTTP
jgi:hypothetical protein